MKRLLGLALATVLAGQASAGIVSVSPDAVGAGQIKVGGTDVTEVLNRTQAVDTIWGFDEQQNKYVSNLGVDGGTISGTVSSHFLFLNAVSNRVGPIETVWTFDGDIVGVMSDSPGILESQSTGRLGLSSVAYPENNSNAAAYAGLAGGDESNTDYLTSANAFPARGLEGSAIKTTRAAFDAANDDAYFIDGNKLYLKMQVSEPGDWIRVVTAVPEPTGIVLWSLGAAGLAFVRGRRKFA